MNTIGRLAKGAPIHQIFADIYGVYAGKLTYLDEGGVRIIDHVFTVTEADTDSLAANHGANFDEQHRELLGERRGVRR